MRINEMQAWMDGGTVTLQCQNASDDMFEIEFVQNVIWDWLDGQKMPGRIYLNGKIVEQRSDLEVKIIQWLSTAEFKNARPIERQLLNEKIGYVKSMDYMTDQKKINEIKK